MRLSPASWGLRATLPQPLNLNEPVPYSQCTLHRACLSESPGWGSKQQHKKTATDWALSIIITIMLYKNVFSGNCVKLYISGRGCGALAPGNKDLLGRGLCPFTLWVWLLIKWLPSTSEDH